MKKYAKFGILIAIIVGSIAWVATASIQSSKTYYVTITELTKMGQQASSKRVRNYWMQRSYSSVTILRT